MSPQIRRPRIRVIEEKSRNRQGVRHSKTFFPPLNSHPPSVPWRALFWLLSLSFVIASPVYSHPEKVKCGKLSQRSTFRTLDFSGGPGCYDWIADAERLRLKGRIISQPIKQRMSKTYCVHVYPRPYIYEGVEAESPEQAETIIIGRGFAGNYDDIQEVEVMASCSCGLDNDKSNEVCEDCGAKL